ncbi:MAG: aminoacyl-tRNA deacylase [Actinomycetes bacterium]
MTPAVVAAEHAGIPYTLHEYAGVEHGEGDYAVAVAHELDVEPGRLFKTLVACIDDELRVYVIPADAQLDLRSLGKRAALADRGRAERATGYAAGGISPLGQRRHLPTAIDESAFLYETILVSAGRRGVQIELSPSDLEALLSAQRRELRA